jgi:uncharacterized Zn-binding protein involved in type VI secretion
MRFERARRRRDAQEVIMSLKIIVVGDKTDHGGTVLGGSPAHDVCGKPIARIGDKVDCPRHGENRVVTAHPTLSVDGVAVAVEGCATECGSNLVGSSIASAAAAG